MSINNRYNLIVVGSGPGGYVAAIRAAQLGIENIAVLERDNCGGVCLNWGCIPSKSFITSANTFNSRAHLEKMGVKVDISEFDFSKVHKASRKAPTILSKGVAYLLKKNGITLINKEFKFESDKVLIASDGERVTADKIIIATGARPKPVPGLEFDEDLILSSKGALSQEALLEKVLIVGSGAIGLEFAYIWNSFGVEVTIIEMMSSMLPNEDRETAEICRKELTKKGIKIHVNTKSTIIKDNGKIKASLAIDKAEVIEEYYDKVLIAIGTTPNTDNLGIENTSISLEKGGYIKVNERFETEVLGVYAIGDAIATLQLAHVASKEGELVAELIALDKSESILDYDLVPKCIYTNPQIASFGLSEEKLKEAGIEYKKTIFPYRANGKSVSIGETAGQIKILTEKDGSKILGVMIVGAEATEIIHELILLKQSGQDSKILIDMIHAHPTLSEIIPEVIKAINGEAIHI